MKFKTTFIPGLMIIEPKIFRDDRGYFFESYNKKEFQDNGIDCDFVQDNQSFSDYGTIRGLHFQTEGTAQAKLVRCVAGHVLDVAVDLRKNSPTYGQSFSIDLTAENQSMFFIPRGFAHGFSVLSITATFAYKCDNLYAPMNQGGIVYDDKDINIDWRIPKGMEILSDKDKVLPTLKEFSR